MAATETLLRSIPESWRSCQFDAWTGCCRMNDVITDAGGSTSYQCWALDCCCCSRAVGIRRAHRRAAARHDADERFDERTSFDRCVAVTCWASVRETTTSSTSNVVVRLHNTTHTPSETDRWKDGRMATYSWWIVWRRRVVMPPVRRWLHSSKSFVWRRYCCIAVWLEPFCSLATFSTKAMRVAGRRSRRDSDVR